MERNGIGVRGSDDVRERPTFARRRRHFWQALAAYLLRDPCTLLDMASNYTPPLATSGAVLPRMGHVQCNSSEERKQICSSACVLEWSHYHRFGGHKALLALARAGNTRIRRNAWRKTTVYLQASVDCRMCRELLVRGALRTKNRKWGRTHSGIHIPAVMTPHTAPVRDMLYGVSVQLNSIRRNTSAVRCR